MLCDDPGRCSGTSVAVSSIGYVVKNLCVKCSNWVTGGKIENAKGLLLYLIESMAPRIMSEVREN